YHLPTKSRHEERMRFKFTNFIISFGVALFFILIGLSAFSVRLFKSISEYHIDNIYDLAAGGNIVNVILVDFRSFDILFETLVFGIAGIGIYALMKLILNRKGEDNEEHTEEGRI